MERRLISVEGTVQGVGFRPFVYGLATRMRLAGSVWNDGGSVRIEVEGNAADLDRFIGELKSQAPPLARIEKLNWRPIAVRGERAFAIADSAASNRGSIAISPDVATCNDCLAELFDPADRRYRYPFINCTNCGPRLTIVNAAPYDRCNTTMAGFEMCAACRAEYQNPSNRRFHAEPIACATCGPAVWLADRNGNRLTADDAVREFAAAIARGAIGALKGLGGYHLVCDATNELAVAELRRRKRREEKPFAVMAADLASVERLCELADAERPLLQSPARPIVLLRMRGKSLASSVAPGNPRLGIMLPYTPLHHLLMRELRDQPLIMTSGNQADEPICTSEPEVFERLGGIADLYLGHNRPIHVRCDDSVTRVIRNAESPVRRSRGYAPQPIRLPLQCATPGLAVGGQLKATFGLARDQQAILSHHIGDLDDFKAFAAFEKDLALYERTFEIRPSWIAHDLHPDYASTRYALRRSEQQNIPTIAVQHHHAHMASCMAENGASEPAIGVSFDGTGFGPDATLWGGEFLIGDYATFRRAAHLRYVAMPGGETAVREPWRMALAHLDDAQAECASLMQQLNGDAIRAARRMIERRFNAPMTSSAGRLFDAVAAIIGLRDRVSYEGQAAMQLQWLASRTPIDGAYDFDLAQSDGPIVIDPRPLIRQIALDVGRDVPTPQIARRFHSSVAKMIVEVCQRLREQAQLPTVALSGGVFMNALLSGETQSHLETSGFLCLRHRVVPPNDGGLSLGQLAVAARQLQKR